MYKDGFRQGDVVIHSSQFSYRPFMVYLDNKFSQFEWDGKENQQPMGHVMEEAHWRGTWMRTGMGGHRVWLVLWPDFQRPGYHNKVLEEMSRRRPFCYKRHREVFSSPQLLVMLYD
jgi:hypothetical protein